MATVQQLLLLLLAGILVGPSMAEMVDIQPYYSLILEYHNNLRRNVTPPAGDMREMMWDDSLAQDAQSWAKYCRYERPPRRMFEVGSNLFYNRKHVRSWHSIRSVVQKGLQTWARSQKYFQYSTDCGSACSYSQMIYSSAYRVGCAMNACSGLAVRDSVERQTTLFVCFYAPKGRLVSTYPYRSGSACDQCPGGTQCSDGLCAEGDGVVMPQPEPLRRPRPVRPDRYEVAPTRAPQLPPAVSADKLTSNEEYFLLQVQNLFRSQEGCDELAWDPKLKQWTDWIVSCQADYPGPPYTYTNFYRCPDHMPAYDVVHEWAKEGRNTNIMLQKGCRTAYDRTECNHYTNMMQERVTAVACSACNCGDGTRQLVCVYENAGERAFRGYN